LSNESLISGIKKEKHKLAVHIRLGISQKDHVDGQ
jgi:hypothetical protein